MSDPTLNEKIVSFFNEIFKSDPDMIEGLSDNDTLDVIITGLKSAPTLLQSKKSLLVAFECDDDDDLPFTELQCQHLWTLINEHNKNFLAKFLQKDTNTANLIKNELDTTNTTTTSNDNNNNTTTTTTPSLNNHDGTNKTLLDSNDTDVTIKIEKAYQTYQNETHSVESESRKQQLISTIASTNEAKGDALLKALGGPNGVYSDVGIADGNIPQNVPAGMEYMIEKLKQQQEKNKPKTALEMAFGSKSTEELLRDELDPMRNIDIQHIDQVAKSLQLNEDDKNQNITTTNQKNQVSNYDVKIENNTGTLRDRDRDYTTAYTDNKYLQINENHHVTEAQPIQHKVYRAVVTKSDRDGYSVKFPNFPKLVGLLPRNQSTAAAGQDSNRRDLVENTEIWVKMLSDYYTVYKEAHAQMVSYRDKKLQTIADNIEKLKQFKNEDFPVNVILIVSMRDVDQSSGVDLNPVLVTSQHTNKQFGNRLPNGGFGVNSTNNNNNNNNNTQTKLTNKKKESFSGIDQQALLRVVEAGKSLSKSENEKWAEERAKDGLSNTATHFNRSVKAKSANQKNTNIDKYGNSLINSDDDGIIGRGIKDDPNMIELSDDDDHVDVDLTDFEPGFLRGFNTNLQALAQESYEATRLTQNEAGVLTMAARKQAENVKERRQLKFDRLKDVVASEMSTAAGAENAKKMWLDPLYQNQEQAKYGNNDTARPLLAQQQQAAIQARLLENERIAAEQSGDGNTRRAKLAVTYGKIVDGSITEQRRSLPVYQLREQFLEMISKTQICIVVGETGSGKTTQMGQYLLEAGYGRYGIIGCTQPRRVAATSVAQRVAEEVGCELGTVVGYSVRFDEKTSPQTRIKYMTDGMLLREILMDPILSRYSVMIIDEAHERGVNTDVLLALIKAACKNRPDLKFIVTSATLDSDKFSNYFNKCPIFSIPGRTFPVDTHYSNDQSDDYFEAALGTVLKIHLEKGKGDILVFLTGEEEINDAVEMLTEHVEKLRTKNSKIPPLDVYPVFSSLPTEIQSLIFEPTPEGRRKCVVATNIAEASVTIDGIVYVVDTGVCKVSVYDAKQGIESLQVTPISQAQARQRAGRAGRTQPGECYRLYTETSFNEEMTPTTVPELQRCDLSSVILLLKALGINDLLGFDFIDPPASSSMLLALRQLFWLGAIDNDGLLTPVGSKLAMLPVSPSLGKMLLIAADLGCVQEIATVVSLVSGDDIWLRPKSEQDNADRAKASLSIKDSDHATLVNVFMKWEKDGKRKEWCKKNYIATRALETASNVRLQLLRTLSNMKVELSSCGRNWGLISRAVTGGLFMNAAKLERQEDKKALQSVLQEQRTIDVYKTLTYGTSAPIHPSSAMALNKPEFIVYQKMLFTTKEWLHTCTTIHPQWLVQLAPHLYAEKTDMLQGSKHNKTRLTELTDKHHAKGAWRLENRAG